MKKVLICVLKGLEQHEGEQMLTEFFFFFVNYSF